MSGHSKWATIKHKKGAADKARAKVLYRQAGTLRDELGDLHQEGGRHATPPAPVQKR